MTTEADQKQDSARTFAHKAALALVGLIGATAFGTAAAGFKAPVRHPYLASRGVTQETVRTCGLGLYTGESLLRGRIVIPIHNASGELIAYAGRAIAGQEPKYRFPAGFRKSLVLFNLHRAIATKMRTVVAVEGFFDTIAVHQAGYAAVGLMGSTLSRHQADLFAGHFDRVC